jgi:hypothetical protein
VHQRVRQRAAVPASLPSALAFEIARRS